MAVGRRARRGLVALVSLALVASLLVALNWSRSREVRRDPVAAGGAGPVEHELPRTTLPLHGAPSLKQVPVEPPRVKAGGRPVTRAAAAPSRSSTPRPTASGTALGGAAGRGATVLPAGMYGPKAATGDPGSAQNLVLRPGYLLGDTSLVAYFDAEVSAGDPSSWAAWWATVTDLDAGTEQRSATLGKADLSACNTVRQFCRSFGAADGWVLDVNHRYTFTVTVRLTDGSEATSAPSGQAKPRATVNPPVLPAAQAVGCGCPNVLGRTVTAQELRADTVNTGTGAFVRTERDLAMSGYGVVFNASRFYSSANPTAGMFGTGWSWTYDARVVAAAGGAVRVRAEDGAEAVYTRAADGSYERPAGIRAKLTALPGGGWRLVPPDQRRLTFDATGRLVSVTDARGHGVKLAYDGTGLLSTITDAAGRVVRIEQRTDVRAIRRITLPDGRSAMFDYQDGRLLKVQSPRGFTTQYGYDAGGRLNQVSDARGQAEVRNVYDPATGRVIEQRDALGGLTRFAWNPATQIAVTTDPDGVSVEDGYRGNVLLYSRNSNGDAAVRRYSARLDESLIVDPAGNQEETGYDAEGNPTSRTAPEPFSFTTTSAYDGGNNLTRHVDARGNTWLYTYNEYNELIAQRDPEQKTGYTYTYDSRGLLATRTDPRGKTTRYSYDAAGNRTADISPTGRRTEFDYDATGRMTAVVDPRGTVAGADRNTYRTRVVYDAESRVLERWDPGKSTPSRTTYDELGQVVVTTDPLGNNQHYIYDTVGRLVLARTGRGDTVAYTYTAAGRRSSVTDGEGNTTTWGYDGQGRPKTETVPLGNTQAAKDDPAVRAAYTTTFHYDLNGQLVRTDRPYPGGGTAQVATSFDELGRPTTQADELGATTRVSYDNAGNVTGMRDETGASLLYSYDKAGRRTGGKDASGVDASTVTYDEMGNVTRQVSPTGGVVTYAYDDDGRPVAVTDPRGNVSGADPAAFTTRYGYDQAGNLTTVTDPLGNTTRYGYDAVGRPTSTTDASGHTTRFGYDAADRLTTVTGPDAVGEQQSLRYAYDANGQVTRRTDPNGHTATIEYDRALRPVVSTDGLGRRRELVYDADSNVVQLVTARIVEGDPRVDPNRPHRTIFNTYDSADRLVGTRQGDDGPVYAYGYDAANRLVSQADAAGTTTHGYDATGRLATVTRDGKTFRYTYDDNDNLTSRTYPDGTKVTAGYDVGDRLTDLSVTRGGDSAAYRFGYDVADQLIRTTYPGGTGVVENRDYDAAGRLSSITATKAGTTLAGYTLTRDGVGNPTRITRTQSGGAGKPTVTETTAYAFDTADRLVSACYGATTCTPTSASAERLDYTYDRVGNRLTQRHRVTGSTGSGTSTDVSTRYSYDAGDQLVGETTTGTAAGAAVNRSRTFTYDLEGNQTKAGDTAFTYNLDHSLASSTVPASGGSGGTGGGAAQTTRYGYDAAGNRVNATTQNADGTGPATTTAWTWDVNNTLPMLASETATRDGQTVAGTSRDFVYAPDGSPLTLLPTSGSGAGDAAGEGLYAYLHDWLGGVSGIVDGAGTPQWAYDYDPFGNPRGEGLTAGGRKLDDAAPANPLQFTGGYSDTSQGDRYALRARNYDPGTGRFGGTDPVSPGAASTAVSSYAYVSNQPTVLTDPSGMYPADPGTGPAGPPVGDPTLAPPATGGGADQGQAQGQTGQVENPAWQTAQKAVAEAEGFVSQIGDEIVGLILDLVGFNDAKKCITEGDIVACVQTALQAVPWGKLFKAAKVAVKAFGVGKRLMEARSRLQAARKALAEIPKMLPKAATSAAKTASARSAAAAKAGAAAAKAGATRAKATAARATSAVKSKAKAAMPARSKNPTLRKANGDAAAVRNCNSFTADTRVVMADGTTKPISDVRPGDTVLAGPAAPATEQAALDQSRADQAAAVRDGHPSTRSADHADHTDAADHADGADHADAADRPGDTRPVARQVTAHITGTGSKQLVDLTLVGAGAGGGGPPGDPTGGVQPDSATGAGDSAVQHLTATDGHPIWTLNRGWTRAGDLHPGDRLTGPDGTTTVVAAVRHRTQSTTVHNLTINDRHTYYVATATSSILVHNCGLSDRAAEIHSAEPDAWIRENVSTVAVVRAQTPHGIIDVIAGSGEGLTPAQLAVPLRAGEMHAPNIPGMHAEQNAFLHINSQGWTPIAGGTSRNVCRSVCLPWIRGSGGRMTGEVYPGSGVTTTRQRSFLW